MGHRNYLRPTIVYIPTADFAQNLWITQARTGDLKPFAQRLTRRTRSTNRPQLLLIAYWVDKIYIQSEKWIKLVPGARLGLLENSPHWSRLLLISSSLTSALWMETATLKMSSTMHLPVTTSTTKETYIGLCDTTFKVRYRNHICSFRNKYIWSLKDQKIAYQIKWRKIKQARSYSNVSKRCKLCFWEKVFILRRPEMSTLNSRNELTSGCRHARKFLLKNVLFCWWWQLLCIVLYF